MEWLSSGNEARWMVDDAFLDILEWMKSQYPQPMHSQPDSSFGGYTADEETESEGHDTIN